MKCTVKEMIEFLSNFSPEANLDLYNSSGQAVIVIEESAYICEWDEALPKVNQYEN